MPNAVPVACHRAGLVALAGRPNCGKSTLLNLLLGQKISIVSPKPQTTRRRILGVRTTAEAQLVLLDTPGIHEARDLLNRRMVDAAKAALEDADVLIWMIDTAEARRHRGGDERVMQPLMEQRKPLCVALNKIDLIDKPHLLPLIAEISRRLPESDIVPISARTGEGVDRLLDAVIARLPEGPPHYSADMLTDESERLLAAELIREQILLETRDEVPYSVAVTIESFEEREGRDLVVIKAAIHVNRPLQKPIVIGKGGARLKRIGQKARGEIERLLGRRVYLELFVRVQEGWTANVGMLKEFGL